MTPQELASLLRKLDRLDKDVDSFRTWLSGDNSASDEYTRVKERIESAFPGLRVIQVDITYKKIHALVANG